eukprot:scaffold4282_cov112-Cylindrotheca_fusiformis.AAC.7
MISTSNLFDSEVPLLLVASSLNSICHRRNTTAGSYLATCPSCVKLPRSVAACSQQKHEFPLHLGTVLPTHNGTAFYLGLAPTSFGLFIIRNLLWLTGGWGSTVMIIGIFYVQGCWHSSAGTLELGNEFMGLGTEIFPVPSEDRKRTQARERGWYIFKQLL